MRLENGSNEKIQVRVLDIKGAIIKNFEVDLSTFEVNIHDFEKGVYILEIKTNNQISRKRLVKK